MRPDMKQFARVIGTLAVVIGGLGSCATLKKDTSVCPEFRSMRCAADTVCTMDEERHCKVCRCRSVNPETDVAPDDSRPPDVTPPGVDPSAE